MLESGIAVAGEKVEQRQAAKDGSVFGRMIRCPREGLIEFNVNAASGGIAVAVEKLGVGTQSDRVLRRRVGRFLQTIASLQGFALAFQLPGLTGGILCGNPHSRYRK